MSCITSPDYVITMSQVELLGVVSGVVDHTHPSHKVNHLFPGSVVQVVPTLVASVSVDPLQPQLAAWSRLIRHVSLELDTQRSTKRRTLWF